MASLHCFSLFLGFSLILLISRVQSLTCSSQKFTSKKEFANCADLPFLDANLRWTYDAANSSLSIAFTATPPKQEGWIAWAINPTGKGMSGAQALIAFKNSNGSMTVKTYDIESYTSILPSKLLFQVPHLSAETSNGSMTIFAMLILPLNKKTVNQVWQVGEAVSNGIPQRHDYAPANMNAMSPLTLVKAQINRDTTSTDVCLATGGSVGPDEHSDGSNSVIPMSYVAFSAIFLLNMFIIIRF